MYRSLGRESYELVRSFLQSPAYSYLVDKGLILATDLIDDATRRVLSEEEGLPDRFYVRHKKVSFISYPYEWSPEMLLDAARCTLMVQSRLVDYGFNLKDASAFNVQFDFGTHGLTPIFIDIGSIEPLPNTGGLWLPYKQFLSHFILPLLYYRTMAYDFKGIFLADLEGFDPEEAYKMVGPLRRFFPPYFILLTLPHWLRRWESRWGQALAKKGTKKGEAEQEKGLYILRFILRFLQRQIGRLGREPKRSEWLDYEERNIYPSEARVEKESFIHRICEQLRPDTVLDIGCNTGRFSEMVAELGARVLAVDNDMISLDQLYRKVRYLRSRILPLRIDITNPSPGVGWQNKERTSFLDRAGKFDCVFALAIVHHLLLTKGVPLLEITSLFYCLTRRYLLVELIDNSDPMFRSLALGKDALFSGLSLDAQEQILARQFKVVQTHRLTGMARKLYLMEKR